MNTQIVLQSPNGIAKAIIHPHQGARLVSLYFGNVEIIKPQTGQQYAKSFASALLFPFANRIDNGRYTFNTKTYQLPCNEAKYNNAIHGLVHSANFTVITNTNCRTSAKLTLQYTYKGDNLGYPFPFNLQLTYTLSNTGLSFFVIVENIGQSALPYTLGWHPYFSIATPQKSSIKCCLSAKYTTNARQLVTKAVAVKHTEPLLLYNTHLDTAYKLNDKVVTLNTPEYVLQLKTQTNSPYLQVFTPQNNTVAIEPMTGVSDSFNHGIGLRVLKPKQHFCTTWHLDVTPS